jgi:hypothetical protein
VLEAFSFYYARLVVTASEDERLIARWAQAEAERAQKILVKDTANLPLIASTYLSQIEKDSNGVWRMGLADFIELCTGITGSRWRLPNCDVKDGWVILHQEDEYSSNRKLACDSSIRARGNDSRVGRFKNRSNNRINRSGRGGLAPLYEKSNR